MDCHETTALLQAYSDDELDPVRSAAMERHLIGCAECAARRDELAKLRARIRNEVPYYPAPQPVRAPRSRPPPPALRGLGANAGAGSPRAHLPAARRRSSPGLSALPRSSGKPPATSSPKRLPTIRARHSAIAWSTSPRRTSIRSSHGCRPGSIIHLRYGTSRRTVFRSWVAGSTI